MSCSEYSMLKKRIQSLTGIDENDMEKFLPAELLLYVAYQLGEVNQPKDFYLLLQNRELMVQTTFTKVDVRLRHLRQYLTNQKLHDCWLDDLEFYGSPDASNAALFCLDGEWDSFSLKDPEESSTLERLALYDEFLDRVPQTDRPQRRTAEAGETLDCDITDSEKIEKTSATITLPGVIPEFKKPAGISKIGGPIEIDWDTVLMAAREMDQMIGVQYREDVLRKSKFMTGQGETANRVTINGVANLLGQVAAGKSTFADPLAVALAHKGMRIVFLETSLTKVCEKVDLFRKVGIKTVGMFSHQGESRRNLARTLYRQDDLFESECSDMVHTGCPLQACIAPQETVITTGEEPCFSLKQKNKCGKEVWYTCPFYGECPTTRKDNDLLEANVIVTTPAGLAALQYGTQRDLLLEYLIFNVDLIIVDEADKVQGQLDGLFCHALPSNDYLKDSANFQTMYAQLPLHEKSEKIKRDCSKYLSEFTVALASISNRVEREHACGFSRTQLKGFTSLRLITMLTGRNEDRDIPISNEDHDILCSLASGVLSMEQTQKLAAITDESISPEMHLHSLGLCKGYISTQLPHGRICLADNDRKTRRLIHSVYFVLLVINFERKYRRLLNHITANPELDRNLTRIIRQTFRKQQSILPAACATGALSLEYREHDDLYIEQQYLTGRSLLYALPHLAIDENGKSCGPNVLLMSGTSLCPGSRMYHIPLPVDYIIEAPKEKREFLSKTLFYFPATEIQVSGVPDDKKNTMLKKLIEYHLPIIKDCLSNGENILMSTNSYAQAELACGELKRLLHEDRIGYLISDKDERKQDAVKLSEVALFNGRILVTPTLVMERGHNIVDELGNSHFNTLMLLVRPLPSPSDFTVHLQRINGAMMQQYYGKHSRCSLELCQDIRKQAYALAYRMKESRSLMELHDDDQKDIMVSLFVTIIQLIGRISRVNTPEQAQHTPKVYFMDGSFQKYSVNYQEFLPQYLRGLMESSEYGFAARTLYEPFYHAIMKGLGEDERF